MASRIKTRTDALAEALRKSNEVTVELKLIDLRTTRGSLRDTLKAAREASATLNEMLLAALREDAISERVLAGAGR